MHGKPPTRAQHHDDDTVTLTFAIPRDVWDLLLTVADSAGDWSRAAARALEVGLEQASMPTVTRSPIVKPRGR